MQAREDFSYTRGETCARCFNTGAVHVERAGKTHVLQDEEGRVVRCDCAAALRKQRERERRKGRGEG